jgi:2-polyprenyl-3-methyl-5-hydroxy-6-metoxy-1,4-benzoquinol methylase
MNNAYLQVDFMTGYRKVLYKNYFSTQLGRGVGEEVQAKFNEEVRQFSFEIVPIVGQNKEAKILDLGCGTGSMITALKNNGFSNVTGVDISAEQVAMAHKMGVSEVVEGDILQYLRDNEGSFDLILGMDIVEHFTKDELCDLLELVKKALRRNGRVVFRTPNVDAPLGSIYAKGDFTHETLLNYNSAEQIMTAIGFKSIAILPSVFKSKNPIKEMLRKVMWAILNIKVRLMLFATGRTMHNVLITPNLIITAGV